MDHLRSGRKIPKNTLRLASLFMALLMWVNLSGRVGGEDNRVVRIFSNVPLVQQGVPENMKLSSEFYQISVTLSGRESEMRELSANEIDVRLNLAEYDPGTYNIPLGPENVTILEDHDSIHVEEIQPRIVRLTLERKIRKNVQIVLSTRGHPDLDFELVSLAAIPETAVIEGPMTQVDELSMLVAEPIDIDGARGDLKGRVRFDYAKQVPPDAAILNLNELTFVAEIREIVETRTIPDRYALDLRGEGDLSKTKIKPAKVRAKITGPVTQLALFEQNWIVPFVEMTSELKKGDQLPVKWEIGLGDDENHLNLMRSVLEQLQIEFEPDGVVVD
ncbi:MAG: hypothetical protein KDC35_01970 [Acidobacteria bacterium]|nr:hypothetical protein [Acidobacteriota bacterium]